MKNAEKYADIALEADKYNAKALVNKGNVSFVKKNYERAKEYYIEALNVEADCVQAIYNLGFSCCRDVCNNNFRIRKFKIKRI